MGERTKKPAYQTDRLFMKEADSFRFFLREVLLRGNCRVSARLVKQRKLSYAKGRAAYLLEGHLKVTRKGYVYQDQSGPAWKDRVAEIYQLQTLTTQEMSGYLDLLRLVGKEPVPVVSLLSKRRHNASEDSYRLYLRELAEEGILSQTVRSNKLFLSGNVDIFSGLTPAQQRQTATLLEWAVAATPYSSFFSSLRKIFRLHYPTALPVPIRYRHLHAHPILDELFYWPVCDAIRQRRWIRLQYAKEGDEEFTVIPLLTVFDVLYGRSYLYCCQKEGPFVLNLRYDRIRTLELLETTFTDEELEEMPWVRRYREALPFVWNISLDDERHLVRLRFQGGPGLAYRVENEGRHGTVTRQEDGSLFYQAEVTDWMEMKSWILSFGNSCEVLSPPGLREEIISTYREMARSYGDDGL